MNKLFILTVALGLVLVTSPALAAADSSAEVEKETENRITEGYVNPQRQSQSFTQTRQSDKRHARDDRWFDIFDVDVVLFDDYDHNGFYSGLDITFDVDVEYGNAWVYAEIWIRPSGGYYELLHSTETFMVSGPGADDAYRVSTELLEHYPTDYYDIMIELYNADDYSGYAVASAGYNYHAALTALPLESRGHHHGSGSLTIVAEGTGSAGWLFPLLLAPALLRLRKKS